MTARVLTVNSYFDGARLHAQGPYTIEIVHGRIHQIYQGDVAPAVAARARHLSGDELEVIRAPFVMPGLVESHCHLFLDGAELDFQVRKDYLNAPPEEMLAVGHRSVEQNLAAGITLIRDAGDIHGINTRIKAELAEQAGTKFTPELRSPGRAIRKAKRYGSFMAVETTDAASIERTIRELAPNADDLKVLLTGIIDFEKAEMKGGVQFDLEETRAITKIARELGLLTYAHCSGPEGLNVAVTAGINSIEHGFFMEREILKRMADQGTAWVPTFSPVYFQFDRPELAGWNEATLAGLRAILDRHFEHVGLAGEMGVPVVAGSDAGSYGVPHGKGLIDELFFMRAAGMPMDKVLAAATSVPRRLWGCEPADLVPGNTANLIALPGSPFDESDYLRQVNWAMRKGMLRSFVVAPTGSKAVCRG